VSHRRISRTCLGCGGRVPNKERVPFRGHRKGCPWKAEALRRGFICLHYTNLEGWGAGEEASKLALELALRLASEIPLKEREEECRKIELLVHKLVKR
jgi:hypothetical protein